jgi:hypothetical protein
MQNSIDNSQKGISLYIAIIILGLTSGIVFGLTSLFLTQTKILRTIGDSVKAFYAADSGIEYSLYNIRVEGGNGLITTPVDLGNGQKYKVEEIGSPPCPTGFSCRKSTGFYKNTQRAIQITY